MTIGKLYIGSTSASRTAYPLRGYGHAGTQNWPPWRGSHFEWACRYSERQSLPAQGECRRRCRDIVNMYAQMWRRRAYDHLMWTCLYTYPHPSVHLPVCAQLHTDTHTCLHCCLSVLMRTQSSIHTSTRMSTHMSISIYGYACLCTCLCIYSCIYTCPHSCRYTCPWTCPYTFWHTWGNTGPHLQLVA